MTLRERLPRWLGGKQRAATEAISFDQIYASSFGPGIGNQPSNTTLLQENLGVSDMATRAIASRVSSLVPIVKVSRHVQDGTTLDEQLDDHPLKMLLDRPHPDFSRAQLLRITAQWIVTVGQACWLKVGNGLRVPVELHPIPPDKIFPTLSQGVVTGYVVTDGSGNRKLLSREEVVRFFFPDPENVFGSEGFLGPAAVTADSLKFAGQHLRSHFQNDATPTTVMKALEGAEGFSKEERDRFYAMWRQHYHSRAGTKNGIPAILPTGYDIVTLMAQSGADVVPLLEHWRDEQLMGFGVPRSVLGQVVSGDRSSAETNQYVFDLHTIFPIANLIAETITLQLAPDFDPSIFVEFEEFVSADKVHALALETADLVGKVRSVNQVREDRGLDPVPWGEEPVGKIGEAPYTGDDFFMPEPDDVGALGSDEPEEEEERKRLVPSSHTRAVFFAPEAEWQRQVAREKAYVPSFEREMKAVLGIQERDVLKKLKAAEPRTRAPLGPIFSPDEWVDLFERRVEPVRVKAFKVILGETLGGLGVEEFVFTDEMRFLLKQQGALLVKHANATTQNLIARQLSEATAEGEGVDQIAKRIKGVFRTRRHHARTIARTEVLKASQEAQVAGFEASGVVEKKQWNTSMDAAVRDDHAEAEGQVRGLRELFTVGGELAEAPGIGAGHSQLSARNSINCRCFVTPVLEG
jgi:phage portal protein BeeE